MKKTLTSEIEFSVVQQMKENEMRVLIGGKGNPTNLIRIILDLICGGGGESNGNCGCNGNCPSCK